MQCFFFVFKISWVVFLFGDHLRLQVPPLGNLHDESYFLPKCWCKNSSFDPTRDASQSFLCWDCLASSVPSGRRGRSRKVEKGAHHLRKWLRFGISSSSGLGGRVSAFSFMDFFLTTFQALHLWGWLVFDGTYSHHLPNRRIGLQNFAWKRCGAPETSAGFKKQAGLVLKVSWKQWSVGGLELLMWLKESSLWLWLFGVVKVVHVFPAFQVQNLDRHKTSWLCWLKESNYAMLQECSVFSSIRSSPQKGVFSCSS